MRIAPLLVVCVGCGRVGFDASSDGAIGDDDAQAIGDALSDGPFNSPDAADITVTFGEKRRTTSATSRVTRSSRCRTRRPTLAPPNNVRVERDQGARGLVGFDVTASGVTRHVLAASLEVQLEDATPEATIAFHAVNEA